MFAPPTNDTSADAVERLIARRQATFLKRQPLSAELCRDTGFNYPTELDNLVGSAAPVLTAVRGAPPSPR